MDSGFDFENLLRLWPAVLIGVAIVLISRITTRFSKSTRHKDPDLSSNHILEHYRYRRDGDADYSGGFGDGGGGGGGGD